MRHIVPAAEEILDKQVKCLDHGHVALIDYMGSDQAIVDAARTSISGQGVKKVQEDNGLIRYLLRNKHTTPFEMVELKFHCKMPIFVARQWIRHRMASVNEMSGRYSVLPEEFYIPEIEHMQFQDPKNKQGRSGGMLPEALAEQIRHMLRTDSENAFANYREYLGAAEGEGDPLGLQLADIELLKDNGGLAKELARINLPLSIYTQWVWKIDLWNFMGFSRLRTDAHAQYEIRVFADPMLQMSRAVAPMAMEAWDDFIFGAVTFSRQEMAKLKLLLGDWSEGREVPVNDGDFKTKREGEEFVTKLKKLLAAR